MASGGHSKRSRPVLLPVVVVALASMLPTHEAFLTPTRQGSSAMRQQHQPETATDAQPGFFHRRSSSRGAVAAFSFDDLPAHADECRRPSGSSLLHLSDDDRRPQPHMMMMNHQEGSGSYHRAASVFMALSSSTSSDGAREHEGASQQQQEQQQKQQETYLDEINAEPGQATRTTPSSPAASSSSPSEGDEVGETLRSGEGGGDESVYKCQVCGWVYNQQYQSGQAFTKQPDTFQCPQCGAGKDEFEREEGR